MAIEKNNEEKMPTEILAEEVELQAQDLNPSENVEIEIDQKRVRPWEIWHLQSDNTKLYNIIGKKIPTSLEDALKKTIDYYYSNDNKWDW